MTGCYNVPPIGILWATLLLAYLVWHGAMCWKALDEAEPILYIGPIFFPIAFGVWVVDHFSEKGRLEARNKKLQLELELIEADKRRKEDLLRLQDSIKEKEEKLHELAIDYPDSYLRTTKWRKYI